MFYGFKNCFGGQQTILGVKRTVFLHASVVRTCLGKLCNFRAMEEMEPGSELNVLLNQLADVSSLLTNAKYRGLINRKPRTEDMQEAIGKGRPVS